MTGQVVRVGSSDVQRTIELGRALARCLQAGDVVVLCGDLGAGKTHFTKGVAQGLGVTDEVTSPTFNIVRLHRSASLSLAHWDLYRIEDMDQLDDVDFFGILEQPHTVSLVEWGDKFPQALPDEWLRIDIGFAPGADGGRTLTCTGFGPRGQQLAQDFATHIGLMGHDGQTAG